MQTISQILKANSCGSSRTTEGLLAAGIRTLLCVSLLTISAPGWSKGQTIRITLEGDGLIAPVEISDPEVVGRFNIWSGPGVGIRDPSEEPDLSLYVEPAGASGRFIDWPRGLVTDRPRELQRLQVTFLVGMPQHPDTARNFVFAYEIDWKEDEGYIFLPMWKNDLIWHGVELNWLHAHEHWDDVIMPIVAQHAIGEPSFDRRSELSCKVGEGSLLPDGTIQFQLIDEAGNRLTNWRYEPFDEGYKKVRDHLGDMAPGEDIEISCWPPRH